MKKTVFTLLLLSLGMTLPGAELVIAEKGKSAYSIVIQSQGADSWTLRCARLISETIFRSTGARLPVIKESQWKNTPAIFLGDVKALGEKGKLAHAEHRIEVRGKDIFLYGNNTSYGKSRSLYAKEQGNYIAAAEFLRRFCGAEMLFPGKDLEGLSVKTQEKLTVPEKFRYARTPAVRYNIGRHHGLYYDIFNGHFIAPWYRQYGGHNYVVAVPVKKYFKTNPEYFALIKGKRSSNIYNHLCISNPTVQKLIKENVAQNLRAGFPMAQLSQSDGFRPCECENCAKLFGVRDFSEKLWILHRNIAAELYKEFPNQSVCIISYGPTVRPPKTFTKFPPNVCIELAPWTFNSLKEWSKYEVPRNFVCYDYTFGSFNDMGLTPKRPLSFIAAHARNIHRDRIFGIYRSGWGDMFGFEAPFFYVWNTMLRDPKANPEAVLKDFCQRLYGSAAPEMEKLCFLMNSRTEKFDRTRPGDFNDPELLAGKVAENPRQIQLLLNRWTPDVLKKMAQLLKDAEKKLPQTEAIKFFWPVVKRDFEYLQLTMRTLNAREALRRNTNGANFRELVESSAARNKFIAAIPRDKRGIPLKTGEMYSFAGMTTEYITANGRLRGALTFPFTGDVTGLQKSGIAACGRVIRTNSAPQQLVGYTPKFNAVPEVWSHPLVMSVSGDEKALTVKVETPKGYPAGVNPKSGLFMRVFVGMNGKRYRFQGNKGYCNVQLRKAVCGVNNAPGDSYSGPRIPNTKARTKETAPGTLVMIIPWSDMGITPAKGQKFDFNVYAQYGKDQACAIWEYNPFQRNWQNPYDRAGTLILE
ncbi:MAG: DUF4838 domain-containing protein [Lentisphaeria bacterium]|nr:DUF4838 domain-containing protein [Lentisphaeria bacterium]